MIFSLSRHRYRVGMRSLVAVSLAVATLSILSNLFATNSRLTLNGVLDVGGAEARATEPPQAEDHPFAVVALASIDRLRARATSLGEVLGEPLLGEKSLAMLLGGDESTEKLLNSPGLDTTRPIGIMSYPEWFNGGLTNAANEDEEQGGDTKTNAAESSPELNTIIELFSDPLAFLGEGVLENSTVALCIPAKDREQLLATISEVSKETFQPIAGHPGWFEVEKDKDSKVGFVGRYLLVLIQTGKLKQWDRNYPDFEKLAKGSLGQHGFAYSLHRRGLPKIMREEMADTLKLAYAAGFQRHDEEAESDFKSRTMFSTLTTDLLDLALSQIEEFRITGHVDSRTHQILVDTELIGPKEGKLAKFASGLKGKNGLFGNASTDDAVFAANVSLPLNPKRWKPVADALRQVDEKAMFLTPWLPDFARTLAKTIDAGQLELHASYARDGTGLLALRVAGNTAFPEQVQAMLEAIAKPNDDPLHAGTVKVAVDSLEGWPVHRVRASMFDSLALGSGLGWSDLTPNDARPVMKKAYTVKKADGGTETGETNIRLPAPESTPQNYVWVVATPSGLWLALSSPDKPELPEWCKTAIVASLVKPTATTTANRSNAPVRVLLRGLGASPPTKDSSNDKPDEAKITQAAGQAEPASLPPPKPKKQKPLTPEQLAANVAAEERARIQKGQEHERGDLIRDGSNAVRVELRPTETGLRVRTTFDDAYFHWFATYLKHSLDASFVGGLDVEVEGGNLEFSETTLPQPPVK